MATVEELVDNNDKDQLIELAKEYELSTEGNKPDIAERIVKYEAGVPQDAAAFSDDEEEDADEPEAVEESNADEQDEAGDEVDPADTQPLEVQETAVEEEPVDEPEDEVLIFYSGQALRFEIAGVRFGRENPFRVVPEETANAILEGPRGKQFRIATPAQAKRFYS